MNCGHLASAGGINVERDQKFESTSLQGRVSCEPGMCGFRGKSNRDQRHGLPVRFGERER
jgi:hypothetical protein